MKKKVLIIVGISILILVLAFLSFKVYQISDKNLTGNVVSENETISKGDSDYEGLKIEFENLKNKTIELEKKLDEVNNTNTTIYINETKTIIKEIEKESEPEPIIEEDSENIIIGGIDMEFSPEAKFFN